MNKKIRITKLDAARRQLITAIKLYFNYGDLLSIHTLAAAAFKITQNICDSSTEITDSVTSMLVQYVKPEYTKEFWRKFHKTTNSLKHADQDPDAVHDFYPEETENILFFAVHQYRGITGEWSLEIRLFTVWYMIQHPRIFVSRPEGIEYGREFFGNDKNRFWKTILPHVQEMINRETL